MIRNIHALFLALVLMAGCSPGERNEDVLASLRSHGSSTVNLIVLSSDWNAAMNKGVVIPEGVSVGQFGSSTTHVAIVGSASVVGEVYLQIFPPKKVEVEAH
jgi:hypothetical protein